MSAKTNKSIIDGYFRCRKCKKSIFKLIVLKLFESTGEISETIFITDNDKRGVFIEEVLYVNNTECNSSNMIILCKKCGSFASKIQSDNHGFFRGEF